MFVYVRVRNREGGNVVSILLYLKKKNSAQSAYCGIILERSSLDMRSASHPCTSLKFVFGILDVSCPGLNYIRWNVMQARSCAFLKLGFCFILDLMWQEWLNRTLAAAHANMQFQHAKRCWFSVISCENGYCTLLAMKSHLVRHLNFIPS